MANKKTNVNVLQMDGSVETVGSVSITILQTDPSGKVMMATGATLPAAGDAGYAFGCRFVLTGSAAGASNYINEGSATSAAFNLVGTQENVASAPVTIATTGTTSAYVIVPVAGKILGVDFSSIAALAASDTNYITFAITNLGQAGAGSTAALAATAPNTTKVTGGSALVAKGRRALTLNATPANLVVAQGDVLQIDFVATGTLAGTVTGAQANVRIG